MNNSKIMYAINTRCFNNFESMKDWVEIDILHSLYNLNEELENILKESCIKNRVEDIGWLQNRIVKCSYWHEVVKSAKM